jgi:hypothetical protein
MYSFGAAVPQPDSPTHSTRTNTKRNRYHYVDKPNNPLAIFAFRYRSRGKQSATENSISTGHTFRKAHTRTKTSS